MKQRVSAQLHDGGVGQDANQVADGVGLSDARRAIEQQPPLDVLSGREQPLPVACHVDDLLCHRG